MKKTILIIMAVVALCLAPAFAQTSITGGVKIPSQSGQAGKYLKTNGSVMSWSTVATSSTTTINLTGTNGTTVTGTSPNFTINSTPVPTVSLVGAGISTVTGTSPNFTVNTLPQAVSLTGAGTTTITGASPNFTINSSAAVGKPMIPIFSGKRRGMPHVGGVSSTVGFHNSVYYSPYVIGVPHVVTKIGINVTTSVAATFCRLAIYADDGFGNPTGAPLDFSGDISTATTGLKEYTFTAPISLTSQLYWLALQSQNGVAFEYVPAVSVLNVLENQLIAGYLQAWAYGAFPTTPSSASGSNTMPYIYLLAQ